MATSGKFRSRAKPTVKVKDAGDHDLKECFHTLNGKYIHYKPKRATEGKEMIKLYDGDGTRELLVPNRNPNELPGIFPKSELERLKKQAHVITMQDRMTMLEEAERKKNELVQESEKRKELLKKSQIRQSTIGNKLGEAQSEAKKQHLYLLQRSYQLLQEQEDNVKKANGIILATKCRAIRNAQIAEKELIEKQLLEEEHRLDAMMEQQRQKAIELEEKKRSEAEQKKLRYVAEVTQQMKENEVEKLIEAERIEEESKMINRVLIAQQKEDEEKVKQRIEQQKIMREEFAKANANAEKYRQLKKEEERLADLRTKEFMRQKMEREEALEQEKRLAKEAKEKELARMRQQQQKAQDYQAMIQTINAERVAEEVERKWREKEKAEAKKRKEMNEELLEARHKQIVDIRRAQALRLAKDEQDFHKVVKIQQEQYQKELENRSRLKEERIKHRKELLKQINERERDRINQQRERFEEGRKQRIEDQVKSKHVEQYVQQKVKKLRETNMPELYIKDIERQLKLNKII